MPLDSVSSEMAALVREALHGERDGVASAVMSEYVQSIARWIGVSERPDTRPPGGRCQIHDAGEQTASDVSHLDGVSSLWSVDPCTVRDRGEARDLLGLRAGAVVADVHARISSKHRCYESLMSLQDLVDRVRLALVATCCDGERRERAARVMCDAAADAALRAMPHVGSTHEPVRSYAAELVDAMIMDLGDVLAVHQRAAIGDVTSDILHALTSTLSLLQRACLSEEPDSGEVLFPDSSEVADAIVRILCGSEHGAEQLRDRLEATLLNESTDADLALVMNLAEAIRVLRRSDEASSLSFDRLCRMTGAEPPTWILERPEEIGHGDWYWPGLMLADGCATVLMACRSTMQRPLDSDGDESAEVFPGTAWGSGVGGNARPVARAAADATMILGWSSLSATAVLLSRVDDLRERREAAADARRARARRALAEVQYLLGEDARRILRRLHRTGEPDARLALFGSVELGEPYALHVWVGCETISAKWCGPLPAGEGGDAVGRSLSRITAAAAGAFVHPSVIRAHGDSR